MKFNLTDFVQLDTKSLLAVNGGSDCGGGTTGPTSNATDPTSGDSGGPGSSTTTESSNNGFYNTKGKTVDQIPSGGKLVTRDGETKKTFTYDNPNGKGTNTVTYAQNKDGSWTVVSNYYYNCSGSSYGSSSTGSGSGACGDYSSSSTKSGTGSTGKTNGGTGSTTTTSTGTGTCGGTSTGGTTTPTIPSSGSFGQITDGSYADKLTMQYYKDKYPLAKNDSEITELFQNDNAMNNDYVFSNSGCLMTDVAKVASEVSGKEIELTEINEKCDINKDGLLGYDEISKGLQDILGEGFEVKTDYWEKQLTKEKFAECAKNGEYVLARALIDDVNGNKLRDDYHWVLLEGYSTDNKGRLYFNFDGTSDNDVNRHYVFGAEDTSKREFSVDKIITVKINKI